MGLNRVFTVIVRGGGGVKTKTNVRMNQKNIAYVHNVTAVRVNACMWLACVAVTLNRPDVV